MKKILVTGGAGFLGSHLCKLLLQEKNIKVICLDNFYTGYKENVIDLIKFENFEIIEHDITKPIKIKVNQIYNLACPASPIHYQKNPVQTIKTAVHGAINMLDLAKYNDAKILQASTSEVYGDPKIHPQKEDYWGNVNPIGIRSCYDEGKRCAETLFFDYHRQLSLKIKIARIFNTYGPNMDTNDGRVVSNIIIQALKDEDITIYGNGNQTRSFCFVDDLIKGLYNLMESNETGPINLGNPAEFKIIELANKIIKITKSKSKIVYLNLPQDDPQQRKPDISLAMKILNWSPNVTLDEGLLKTIDYFKKNLN